MKKGHICKNGSTQRQSAENKNIKPTKEDGLRQTPYITSEELRKALKISKGTLVQFNKEGCPRVYFGLGMGKKGSNPRYKLDDVTAWLEKRTQEFLKKGGQK